MYFVVSLCTYMSIQFVKQEVLVYNFLWKVNEIFVINVCIVINFYCLLYWFLCICSPCLLYLIPMSFFMLYCTNSGLKNGLPGMYINVLIFCKKLN